DCPSNTTQEVQVTAEAVAGLTQLSDELSPAAQVQICSEDMQMQNINVQKKGSSSFSVPTLPPGIVSPEEPVDIRVKITVLKDNDPLAEYRYMLTISTGHRHGASTTSQVTITLLGTEGESEPHHLADPGKPVFERGGMDLFLLTTHFSLGDLQSIRLWHDNSGDHPACLWGSPEKTSEEAQKKSNNSVYLYKQLGHVEKALHLLGPSRFPNTSSYNRAMQQVQGIKSHLESLLNGDQVNRSPSPEDSISSSAEKKRCQGGLPWWFVFVGWILVIATSTVSGYFTMMYGLTYGKDQSINWLISMVVSFFESLFITQPLK
ncbi:hypothetical protein XENOCAPTIV_012549, partial [Xenoophorus captivus]